jgi:YYY domain-containing protein
VSFGAGALAFGLTNPFSLIELQAFAGNILAQNAMVSGVMDAPYTRQFARTLPYLYFMRESSQWGLGWPLGLAAWAGFAWCAYRALRRRAGVTEWIMLAWAAPYFAVTGLFHAKFLRYIAPLLPFLLVMAAGMLWTLRDAMIERWGRRGRVAWTTGLVLLLGFTATWALAFTAIYRQEHPWLQASRWIYQNVPDGATLLTEHWDDALPLRMDEIPDRPPLREYRQVELPLWDADTAEKRDALAAELSAADYVVLATNRLHRPIQRLPQRYPMASQYYTHLFSGGLGYEKVAEFNAYPRIGGVAVLDDNADESFTVYDHPRVMIFANTGRLSESVLRSRLGRYLPLRTGVNSSKAVGLARYASQADHPSDELLLSQPVETLPVVYDFRWNAPAAESPPLAALLFWLVIGAFGWVVWPLIFPLLPGLRDRGYGLSRALGWLLLGWLHWIGVNLGLWQNRIAAIALVLGVLALFGAVAAWRQRGQIRVFVSAHRGLIAAEEGVFALALVALVVIRLFNPDLWQPWNGGEKFMEFAFLNAILRSAQFPPYDPYFAGGILNYYYYGLYLVSLPIKLTGIPPEVAFNLTVPPFPSAQGVFSVGAPLARISRRRPESRERRNARMGVPRRSVTDTAYGQLASFTQTLDNYARMGGWQGPGGGLGPYISGLAQSIALRFGGAAPPGFDYWAPSRVIPYTINEFPFWTFLFADLHPHLVSIPFGVAVIGLSLHLLLPITQSYSQGPAPPNLLLRIVQRGLNLALLSLVLGSLGAINTWDLPTYTILVAGCLLLAGWRSHRWSGVAIGLVLSVAAGFLAVIMYLPFYRSYQVQVGRGDGWTLTRYLGWVQDASPLGDWLRIWLILLVLAVSFGLIDLAERRLEVHDETRAPGQGRPRWGVIGFLLCAGAVALLVALERPTAAVAAVPLILGLYAAVRPGVTPQRAFLAWLIALGSAVLVGTELIYLRDFLDGGDWERMNTVFKFSVPAWMMLGLAGGSVLWLIWRSPAMRPADAAAAFRECWPFWWPGSMWLPASSPLRRARVDDRVPGPRPPLGTLDGTAYLAVGEYEWPSAGSVVELRPEREAIRWLLEHVAGSPLVAEAPAGEYVVDGRPTGYDYYRAGGLRAASMTGLPTLVGHHQYEQRDGRQVSERTEEGKEFFQTTDIARTRDLMAKLGVRYIYVGALERILFSEESLRKFDILADSGELSVVFDNGPVRIYRVQS